MKIKVEDELESYLNMIYESYILANNNTLDESAIRLKEHYEYVINDLGIHGGISINKEDRDVKNKR